MGGDELCEEAEELEWFVEVPEEFVVVAPEGLGMRYFAARLRVERGEWYVGAGFDIFFSSFGLSSEGACGR